MTLDERARELLRLQLIRREGVKFAPYRDKRGKLTIGVGRNLDDVGISAVEAYYLLDNDIDRTVDGLAARFPEWFPSLDPVRQAAIIDPAFNMGVAGFAGFKRAIAALEKRDYVVAAAELRASRWLAEVGARAQEVAAQVKTGEWFPRVTP